MVVCGQSSFSAKACDGGYEVSRTAQLRIPPADHRLNIVQEAEAGVGTLQKIEPSVAKAMLRYMCEGNYTDAGHVELPPLMFDIHIHTVALSSITSSRSSSAVFGRCILRGRWLGELTIKTRRDSRQRWCSFPIRRLLRRQRRSEGVVCFRDRSREMCGELINTRLIRAVGIVHGCNGNTNASQSRALTPSSSTPKSIPSPPSPPAIPFPPAPNNTASTSPSVFVA